eukprot:TRINITY_DN166_c0_g1_i1.p1 TRINITY_DN166_c0_g1~~TRINITY_DN166_c0_g1_i1.p1  ORF type:complete len:240 (-),score=70.79 TRINITY_DN166_c0_g1_i1:68-787(-)
MYLILTFGSYFWYKEPIDLKHNVINFFGLMVVNVYFMMLNILGLIVILIPFVGTAIFVEGVFKWIFEVIYLCLMIFGMDIIQLFFDFKAFACPLINFMSCFTYFWETIVYLFLLVLWILCMPLVFVFHTLHGGIMAFLASAFSSNFLGQLLMFIVSIGMCYGSFVASGLFSELFVIRIAITIIFSVATIARHIAIIGDFVDNSVSDAFEYAFKPFISVFENLIESAGEMLNDLDENRSK